MGTIKAAKHIGRESIKLISPGVATKASECMDYDPRLILANSIIYATEPRRAIQLLHAVAFPLRRWVWWLGKQYDDSLLSSDIFRDIAEKYWGGPAAADLSSYEGKALAAIKIQDYGYIKESGILCDIAWPIIQVHSPDSNLRMGTMESRVFSAVTGIEMDENELMLTGERIFNLQRAVLMRQGWGGREGDTLLEHFHAEPLEDILYFSPGCIVPDREGNAVSRKGTVIEREAFENMKSEYYSLRGWDAESGFQTQKKLEELNLGDIAAEMNKMKLLR
jgi:aldehyde:ferredoxin oxidoreductase